MKPKISIIIPVYNSEEFLEECLNSSIHQTLQEIEIVIINDASTDKSLQIIKDFQVKDSRIKLIDFKKTKETVMVEMKASKKQKGSTSFF